MLRLAAISIAVAALLPAQDQPDPELALRERAQAMIKEAMSSRNAHRILAGLVQAAPHRLAGSAGAEAAVAWAAAAMKRAGLENVRQEPVTVPRWVRGTECDVRIAGEDPPLAALALGGSVATSVGGIEAEVIEVLSFPALRALGDGARGKIVFLNRPFDTGLINTFTAYGGAVGQRSQGAIEAAKAGAVAVLVRSVTSEPDDVPHTGAMNYQEDVARIPAAAISVVAAERLHARLAAGAPVRARLRMNCATLDPVPSANVVGEIPGRSAPGEVVLLGAHLDAWDVGQGAHDDGAGCAHVLEAARLLLASGPRPRRTVRCVLFMNEENGLAGGKAYAERHAADLAHHVFAIETDSGGFSPRGFSVTGGRAVEDALGPAARLLGALDLGEIRPGGGGADISTLAPAGVPLAGMRTAQDRYFDLHHTVKDTLDTVHPRELSLGAATLAAFALSVAESEAPIPRTAEATK